MEEENKKSVLDETKELLAALKVENDRYERLRSDQLLSGTAGPRVEPVPPKKETAKEYADRVMRNDIDLK